MNEIRIKYNKSWKIKFVHFNFVLNIFIIILRLDDY